MLILIGALIGWHVGLALWCRHRRRVARDRLRAEHSAAAAAVAAHFAGELEELRALLREPKPLVCPHCGHRGQIWIEVDRLPEGVH